jgi:hypothetical protein
MTYNEIRQKILEMLYELFKEHPYHRLTAKDFRESMNIGMRDLNFNIIYLEEKGLVELQKPLEGSLFVGARITPKGIDLVEDEYQLSVLFPLQTGFPAIPEKVFEQLDSLISATSEKPGLSTDSKELITEELAAIRNELRKTEPGYSTIKNNVDRLKERDHDIWRKLTTIIKDPALANALSRAARKDLGI